MTVTGNNPNDNNPGDARPDPDEAGRATARAVGRIPSGVFILTATHEGRSAANLVSWVQQVGMNPLAVCLAIAAGRPILQLIRDSRQLCLSILGQEDTSLMKRFARPAPPHADPFAGVQTIATPAGLPALAGAIAWIQASLVDICHTGLDHELLVARVDCGHILKDEPPFLHVRGSGRHY